MSKYEGMTVKELSAKIEETTQLLDGDLINVLIIIGIFIAMSLIIVFVHMFLTQWGSQSRKVLSLIGVGILFLSVLAVFAKGLYSEKQMQDDLKALIDARGDLEREIYANEQKIIEGYAANEVATISLKDIVHKAQVKDDYCPELERDEDCYFIEFLSDSNKTQAVIPFNENTFTSIGNEVQLSYYVLTEKEFKLYKKHFNLNHKIIEGNEVFPNTFVVGAKLEK